MARLGAALVCLLFAIPFGLIFLGERLTTRAVIGTLVTVAGVTILQL